MTKPVLYLHIGTNKTGTSAIQLYCSAHRDELLRQRLLYPLAGCVGVAHYGFSKALGFAHGPGEAPESERAKLLDKLDKEFRKSHADACVISTEDFVLHKAVEPVRTLFSGFECRIVVYLRRHDSWWESAYAQAVKMKTDPPWKPGIKKFIGFHSRDNLNCGNYRFLLDRWATVFGVENMIVRPYEPAQNPGGIVADFFRTMGFPELASQASIQDQRVNESPSPPALFVLDILQRAQIDADVRSKLMGKVMCANWKRAEYSLLPPRYRKRLIEANLGDYEYIARTYMGRPDGVLFTDPVPQPNDPWKEPETPDVVEVVSRLVNYCTER